jgi:hypothetical protein
MKYIGRLFSILVLFASASTSLSCSDGKGLDNSCETNADCEPTKMCCIPIMECVWNMSCNHTHNCIGKCCGDDGCCSGSTCGDNCTTGEVCDLTTCTCVSEIESVCDECTPQCEEDECGPDECGWYCGGCEGGPVCMFWSKCGHEDPPDCTGRNCGPDPVMQQSCGTCPDNWECHNARCQPEDGGCGEVGIEGQCINGFVAECVAGSIEYEQCWYRACVEDENGASCVAASCFSDCYGRECGYDACIGMCGECPNGTQCDVQHGICVATELDCSKVAELGECHGHVLVSCEAGEVKITNCLAEGKICYASDGVKRASCCYIKKGTPCGDLPATGHCENDILFFCESELKAKPCVQLGWSGCERIDIDKLGCR